MGKSTSTTFRQTFRPITWLALLIAIALTTGCTPFTTLLDGTEMPMPFPRLESFRIVDPYAVSGEWYKVQLHVHSAASIDSKWPVESILQTYATRGYDFVAITDHDVLTITTGAPPGLIPIPAQENTIPRPFYPIGPHAIFLFTEKPVPGGSVDERFGAVAAQGGLVSLAHPNWPGNLGHGRWRQPDILTLPHVTLMEIVNPYSSRVEDEATWHYTAVHRGMNEPVWAVAVDDAHEAAMADVAWSMVKAEEKTLPALREALRRGSHFPTTGVYADFRVAHGGTGGTGGTGGAIHVTVSEPAHIQFIDGYNKIVHETSGVEASYTPRGDEGFVRIALRSSASNKRAWSQPFWLVER